MTYQISQTAMAMAGAGLGSLCLASTSPKVAPLKALGLAAIGFALASPAHADQLFNAGDNSRIVCSLARNDLNRISLVGDSFANVSKISGGPYGDIIITHEPVRGDLYLSVPPHFASERVTFFATTRAGYVYQFTCLLGSAETQQIFIANPALKAPEPLEQVEADLSPDDAPLALIGAMASEGTLSGYAIERAEQAPQRRSGLELQQLARYDGSSFTGLQYRLTNIGKKPIDLDRWADAPLGALAYSFSAAVLKPGQSADAYLVFAGGGHGQ